MCKTLEWKPCCYEPVKLKDLKSHYINLVNAEFPWDNRSSDNACPVESPPICTTEELVSTAIQQMWSRKAIGLPDLIVEIVSHYVLTQVVAIIEV